MYYIIFLSKKIIWLITSDVLYLNEGIQYSVTLNNDGMYWKYLGIVILQYCTDKVSVTFIPI